jgi:uncharacterized protein (TIGR00369 family)
MSVPQSDTAAFIARHGVGGHSANLGLRFIASGDDWSEFALDYDPRLAADAVSGIFASGPIISLLDVATGVAAWVRGGAQVYATVDLRLDYLRPALPGRTIFGRGECYRLTRSIAFVRGQAHDGDPDDPVAHAVGTFMIVEP